MIEALGGNWLVRKSVRDRTPAKARVFCFPNAGAGASVYRLWAAGLPADLEVCAVQLPGRESRLREPPLGRIDLLVDALLPVLRPLLDLPFALFGHSMGAVLATEITMALAASGGPLPQHLFVSSRRPLDMADPDTPLAGLTDAAFVTRINERYGGIPEEILRDAEMMELLLPSLRADIAALENHVPLRPTRIAIPLSVFGGTHDKRVPAAHLRAWRSAAAGEFRVRLFEGDHFYITPRRVEVLADIAATLAPLLRSDCDLVVNTRSGAT